MTPRLETSSSGPDAFPRGTDTVRRFLLLFLALAALISATSFETLFRLPGHEEGDDAANGLQIHRAKRLVELYGNYSRWGFHHPGPAFFYCYALGEAVLHDATGIMPRPRNAHVYAGLLVQLAFYAAAIALLGRYARWPLLTMALAVLLGAWHFAHVARILFSVWPPDVLLMPFLCFVVACAGVMIGDRVAVPIAVVAGSFLVHGHVAQPLFVVPIFGLAAFSGFRRIGLGGRELLQRRSIRVALGLLALFLLPIVLDLFRGRQSNAYDIWVHLRFQTDDGRTLWQSVLCYASYFIGQNDPSMFNTLDASSYAPFRARAGLLGLWAAAGVGVIGWLVWGWRRARCLSVSKLTAAQPGSAPTNRTQLARASNDRAKTAWRFGAALTLTLVVAGALTLVWGMRQDGGFTDFNSHFNHTLVHAHGLLAVLALTSIMPVGSKRVASVLLAAASFVFAVRLPCLPETYRRSDELAVHVRGLLRADPSPAAPKLILFDTEPGVPHWFEAVTLARQLQLAGVRFYVSPDWRVMFGDEAVLPDDPAVLARVSVWKIVGHQPAAAGRHRLNGVCDVVFPTSPSVQGWPLRLDFAEVKTSPVIFYGFGPSEGEWAWTTARIAQLRFNGPDTVEPLRLTIKAAGLTAKGFVDQQNVRISVNGTEVGEVSFGRDPETHEWSVPAAVWNAPQPRVVTLEIPGATSPARVGKSADRRVLGLRVYALTLSPSR